VYAVDGRPSIPPERLLRASLLQAFYTIRSERQLMEQIDYNLLYRWFVGLGIDDPVWVPTVFSKNRDRLLDADVAKRFLKQLLAHQEVSPLLSDEHPRLRVVFREVGKRLFWGQVCEAFEACVIIVIDELGKEGVAIIVAGKQPVSDTAFLFAANGFVDAAVEALDHAVGLGMEGFGETVFDAGLGADPVERTIAGRLFFRLAGRADGEAVGELGSVVGENGVHLAGKCARNRLRRPAAVAASRRGWISR
jgi:hypothetical protein